LHGDGWHGAADFEWLHIFGGIGDCGAKTDIDGDCEEEGSERFGFDHAVGTRVSGLYSIIGMFFLVDRFYA
jgi:hypothetical protein